LLVKVVNTAEPGDPAPVNLSADAKSLVDGNTEFALDLYQKLKEQPGNLFCSPYSISTALAMTRAGARGTTESEMAHVLHFTVPQENLPAAFAALTERMKRIQNRRITLTTANALWRQKGYHFLPAFLDQLRTGFDAESREVDFVGSPSAASGEINQWVGQKTAGKIKDIAAPGQFTSDTRLVLCNAIYFKGTWLKKFKEADTRPEPFHISTNQTVTASMMHQTGNFRTASSDDSAVQMLELPYSGRDLSMIILLPNSVLAGLLDAEAGLPDLERRLTAATLREWLTRLDRAGEEESIVALPRFTTTQEFELSGILKSMGIPTAFGAAADFSGVDATDQLFISGVMHKAFVEVNEAGTEAAAATTVTATLKAETVRFIADHPFLFLIRDNGTGSILFLGRIVDPTR
jgi:serpin B